MHVCVYIRDDHYSSTAFTALILYKLLYDSVLAFRVVKRAYETQILGRKHSPHKLRNIYPPSL